MDHSLPRCVPLLKDGDDKKSHPHHHERGIKLEVEPARAHVIEARKKPLEAENHRETVIKRHIIMESVLPIIRLGPRGADNYEEGQASEEIEDVADDVVEGRDIPKVLLALEVVVALELIRVGLVNDELHRGDQVESSN